MLYVSSRRKSVPFRPFSAVSDVYVALLSVRFVKCHRSLSWTMQQVDQTVRKPTACTYSALMRRMLGLLSEGMNPTCSMRSVDEMLPRFKDYRNVSRTRMVDHVTSEPTTSYPWDLKNRVVVSHQPLFRRCLSPPRPKALHSSG